MAPKKRPPNPDAPTLRRPRPKGRRRPGEDRTHGASKNFGKGKPLLCTPELTTEFAELTRQGLPLSDCADLLRIGRVTVWKWMQNGRVFEENEGQPEIYFPYFAFRQEVLVAQAQFRQKMVKLALTRSKDPNMRRAKAWQGIEVLRRRDTKNWGAHERAEEEADDGGNNPDLKYL